MDPSNILNASGDLSFSAGSLFGMSMWGILASLVFSTIGIFYFKRGKSQSDIPMLICGVALMVYPYFISNTLYIVLIGASLAAAPCVINRM